jgi:diguanylate cyclase (GGDEF)-like protein
MGDGLRTVRLVSGDEATVAAVRAAVGGMSGYGFVASKSADELVAEPSAKGARKGGAVAGDVLLLDARLAGANVYEVCRQLVGKTRCRTWILVDEGNRFADGIAHFCGATGTIAKPLSAAALRKALESGPGAKPAAAPEAARSTKPKSPAFPEALLRDLSGGVDHEVVTALTDPESNLFNYAFLNYKLDEEVKRAQRFGQPLSCVMVGFEGEVSTQVLRELSGIFLQASRDTDVLGRFDVSSFLFFLPSTGPDGAQVMARRVQEEARKQGLRDLVGDPLSISVGIASMPHPEVRRREDLFARARRAFVEAQKTGGVVTSA